MHNPKDIYARPGLEPCTGVDARTTTALERGATVSSPDPRLRVAGPEEGSLILRRLRGRRRGWLIVGLILTLSRSLGLSLRLLLGLQLWLRLLG